MSDVKLRRWLARRDLAYIVRRACSITRRYGISSVRARRRTDACVSALAAHGCMPTFMVPGRVVQAHAEYARTLADRGVELALHGFDHVDFTTLSPAAIVRQFTLSVAAFERAGVPFHGFRCPYLSASDDVFRHLVPGRLVYSSNVAIQWPEAGIYGAGNTVSRQLEAFYAPRDAKNNIALPLIREDGLIELPCALPDDIQLYDGLGAGELGLEQAWCRVLKAVHARGELHVVLFHPELADRALAALEALLVLALGLHPPVWVATLRDVATWWQERSECHVDRAMDAGRRLVFTLRGNARARLVAGHVTGREIAVEPEPMPLVGVSTGVSESSRRGLRNLGYILEEAAPERCMVVLDDIRVDRDLVRRLERHPLVRVAAWPDGAGAALCISGDLDALSLVDYARRFWSL